MKAYKVLIPLALMALMAVSIFNVLSTANKEKQEYENLLTEARRLAELDVIEDSMLYYKEALEIRDEIDVNVEIGQVYVKHGWTSEAIEWGEYLIEKFPKEPRAYNFLLEQYIDSKNYEECFELRNAAYGREAKDAEFDEKMTEIEYVFESNYEGYEEVGVYSMGLCPVMEDGLWGYVTTSGGSAISKQFAWAGPFSSDGIAPVKTQEGEFYYINMNGNKKVAVQNLDTCMALGMSIDNILPAGNNGVYGYYNHDFEKIIDGEYSMARPMNGNVAAVEENGAWYLINKNGEKISSTSYDTIFADEKGIVYRNDRVFVKNGDNIVMIDGAGKQIGSETYEDVCIFFAQDSYAAVKTNGKWGFVDKDGNIVIEPQYDNARSFVNNFAAVQKDGDWGFIDVSGTMVIPNEYKDAKDMNEAGFAFVYDGEAWDSIQLIRNTVD